MTGKETAYLFRIEAPHFVAGVFVLNSIIETTAPILKGFKNQNINIVLKYWKSKNYKIKYKKLW